MIKTFFLVLGILFIFFSEPSSGVGEYKKGKANGLCAYIYLPTH